MRHLSIFLQMLWLLSAPHVWSAPPVPANQPEATVETFEGAAQGTTYQVRYAKPVKAGLPAEVEKILADFDKVFSNYRHDSEISRFNAQNSLEWVPVSSELAILLDLSLSISRQTLGTFDVTIGTLVKEWGFGPYKKTQPSIPGPELIKAALAQSGFDKLEVRLKPPALRKKSPGLLVDLSGVAQGFAVDTVAKKLEERGVHSYMVEIGGEVITKGQKSPGQDWKIAIEAPLAKKGFFAELIVTKGLGLATSGDYRSFFQKDGKRYSHIMDPRTGRPIEHALASVSVLARTCAEADAFAKAFMVLGPVEGKKLAEKLRMPVYFISHEGQDFSATSIAGFENYFSR